MPGNNKNGSKAPTIIGIMFGIVMSVLGLLFGILRGDVGQIEQAIKENNTSDTAVEKRVTCLEIKLDYELREIKETLKNINPSAAQKAAAVIDSIKAINDSIKIDSLP